MRPVRAWTRVVASTLVTAVFVLVACRGAFALPPEVGEQTGLAILRPGWTCSHDE